MKFYEPTTWFGLQKKFAPHRITGSSMGDIRDFYHREISESLVNRSQWQGLLSASNMMAELEWYKRGKPYYKIWPGVFDPFIATRLDISTNYLRAPHRAFVILLPEIDEPLLSFSMSSGVWSVCSILVEDYSAEEVKRSVEAGLVSPLDQAFPNSRHKDKERGIIKIRIDFESKEGLDKYLDEVPEYKDALGGTNIPSTFFRNIEVVPDVMIETAIGEFIDIAACEKGNYTIDPAQEIVPAEIVEACFRLVIGIYFISTGSQKVLEYDVLSKHLTAYQQMRDKGDWAKCKEYERQARAKGKYGWNVGIDRKGRDLILPKGVTYEDAVKQAGGSHLLYRHHRGGHWHLYWTGTGKQTPVVKWVDETVVRPDLPIKPQN
jgi:hypothetical protein